MATKLTAKLARDLANAEAVYSARAAAAEKAKVKRDRLRDRCRPALPSGEASSAGGVTVKRTVSSQESFSVKGYREAGHRITAAMRKFITPFDRETWTVTRQK